MDLCYECSYVYVVNHYCLPNVNFVFFNFYLKNYIVYFFSFFNGEKKTKNLIKIVFFV